MNSEHDATCEMIDLFTGETMGHIHHQVPAPVAQSGDSFDTPFGKFVADARVPEGEIRLGFYDGPVVMENAGPTPATKLDPVAQVDAGKPFAMKEYWRCFHCDFATTNKREAEAHFGDRDDDEAFKPICKWWAYMDDTERKHAFQDVVQQLQEALSPENPPAVAQVDAGKPIDEIMTRMYRRFKEWSKRGFGADDVTWCEVKQEILELIALQPAVAQTGLPPIPDDLKEECENARIGAVNYGDSVTGAEYRMRIRHIERIASLTQRLQDAEQKLDFCGTILGTICVYGTLGPGEKPVDPPPHASVDAILTQIERAEKAEQRLQEQEAECARRKAQYDDIQREIFNSHTEYETQLTALQASHDATLDALNEVMKFANRPYSLKDRVHAFEQARTAIAAAEKLRQAESEQK